MRYAIECLVPYAPDDAGWEPYQELGNKRQAIGIAQSLVVEGKYGPSGVRVYDERSACVIWDSLAGGQAAQA